MTKEEMRALLDGVQSGAVSTDEALLRLKSEPFDDLGYAKVDHQRAVRQGVAEVIYGAGKTPEQILGIAQNLREHGNKNILITRMSAEAAAFVGESCPLEYHALPRLGIVEADTSKPRVGSVAVVSAGTSDMAVAEEAALTAEALGSRVTRIYDAGVAGLHRLLAHVDELTAARAVVAVAGMEGALASVVGGLVEAPVIAVPTSVGYGANFGGMSALLSMLNSCASGVSVVNIDNGFGAGYLAHIINKTEGIR